jgi:hypothetical protein
MNRHLVRLAALALLLVPAPASADEYVNKESGLEFELPEGWTTEEDGTVRVIRSPDDELFVVMTALDPAGLEPAKEAMDEELADVVEDVQVTSVTFMTLNNMEACYVNGTGVYREQKLKFKSVVVDAGDHCLLVMGMGSEDALKKHGKTMREMFKSIRKADADKD